MWKLLEISEVEDGGEGTSLLPLDPLYNKILKRAVSTYDFQKKKIAGLFSKFLDPCKSYNFQANLDLDQRPYSPSYEVRPLL